MQSGRQRRPRIRTEVSVVWAFIATAAALLNGCYLRPEFGQAPGTIYYQRSRAVVHDPFPDNSIGPPVVGGRPFGYEKPQSEAVRAQTSPYAQPPRW